MQHWVEFSKLHMNIWNRVIPAVAGLCSLSVIYASFELVFEYGLAMLVPFALAGVAIYSRA